MRARSSFGRLTAAPNHLVAEDAETRPCSQVSSGRGSEREKERTTAKVVAFQDTVVVRRLFLSWLTCQRKDMNFKVFFCSSVAGQTTVAQKKAQDGFQRPRWLRYSSPCRNRKVGKKRVDYRISKANAHIQKGQDFTIQWTKKGQNKTKLLGEYIRWQNRRFHFHGPRAGITA